MEDFFKVLWPFQKSWTLTRYFQFPKISVIRGIPVRIQAAAYNGARKVFGLEFISWDSISTSRIYIGLKLQN